MLNLGRTLPVGITRLGPRGTPYAATVPVGRAVLVLGLRWHQKYCVRIGLECPYKSGNCCGFMPVLSKASKSETALTAMC